MLAIEIFPFDFNKQMVFSPTNVKFYQDENLVPHSPQTQNISNGIGFCSFFHFKSYYSFIPCKHKTINREMELRWTKIGFCNILVIEPLQTELVWQTRTYNTRLTGSVLRKAEGMFPINVVATKLQCVLFNLVQTLLHYSALW